jgi:DNA-binding SARP family transcriptional activator
MTFRVDVLGGLLIRLGGAPITLKVNKARGAMAYLAVAASDGREVSRPRLATLLWPNQATEQSMHSLRNCLLQIRKALYPVADKVLIADYANCRYLAGSDVADFRAADIGTVSAMQSAADLYRGDFLDDLDINSEPWEEWLSGERERWRLGASGLFAKIVAQAMSERQHDTAISAARRMLALDSFDEAHLRLLMEVLVASGRGNAALRQYTLWRKDFIREMQVPPEAETRALHARIVARQRAGTEPEPHAIAEPEPQAIVMARMLVQLEAAIATRQVGMSQLKLMRDEIKRLLGDAPPPAGGPRPMASAIPESVAANP